MMRVTYCRECGVKANPNKDRCHLCGGTLPHSRAVIRNPGVYAKMAQERPKAVIFDLDMTIFNNSQRFTDARRAGLVDKEGKAVAKGMMSIGQAWRKRNKFIYSNKALAKDTVIPGAKELVSDLVNDGYVIVYLTARPEQYYEASLKQLESNGFPLYRDKNDKVLLITKPLKSSHTAKYKANAARELSGEFKVEMVFDDDKKVLEEMAKLRIPGLYASISDHVKTNPHHYKVGMDGLDDDGNWPSRASSEEEKEEEVPTLDDFLEKVEADLPNPLPKPKRKKLKTGKFRKEPARKYLSRLMGVPKMREEFPNSKQRFAVAIGLVKKYYNAETANKMAPRANPKIKTNPADKKKIEKGKKFYKHMNGQEPEKIKVENIDIGDVWYKVGEGGCWQIGYISGKDNGRDDQKYTHVFNEETKDGNFPELYATMPKKGKPMLIIKGGTWKIKTDDQGVAWIYD